MKPLHFLKSVRIALSLLLIAAGMKASLPFDNLIQSLTQFYTLVDFDAQDIDDEPDTDDERDEKDERDEPNEREKQRFEDDYLAMQHCLKLIGTQARFWHAYRSQAKLAPIMELNVPPPKLA